jgi:transcriptional regulator GlxA family with amidase domain
MASPGSRIAVFAFDGMSPFHLSVPCLVFGDRFSSATDLPRNDVTVCAERPGALATNAGFGITVEHDLDAMRHADIVILPSWVPDRQPSERLLDEIRSAHRRGATVVGLCLGAYLVAASGVADGREIVTHWSWAADLAERYPVVDVKADRLWSDLGDVVTSAGTAAALDCCLHLIRRDQGVEVAERIARAIVVAPHRSGSQAQYIEVPVATEQGDDPVERAMVWARANLDGPLTLDDLAARAAMSRRSFTRHFRARTGSSGQQWLLNQRLDRARALLETTDLSIERIAADSGFGSAAALRHHFRATLRTTPQRHRADFARPVRSGVYAS